jgi:hypothetical protein
VEGQGRDKAQGTAEARHQVGADSTRLMIIDSPSIFQFLYPLSEPLRNSSSLLHSRQTLLVPSG